MARDTIVDGVIGRYPRTYGEEAGIRSPGAPSGLYRLLVLATLMSARIRASVALDAAKALSKQRWTTAAKMAASDWADRARVLNEAGYARFDERTATMLGDSSQLLLDRYKGDLRRLRTEADRDPAAERRLLKECKGIGDVGVDIFFREVQGAWDELYPFADRRALKAAERLGLGDDVAALSSTARGDRYVRLVSGLVRVDLDGVYDEIGGGGS